MISNRGRLPSPMPAGIIPASLLLLGLVLCVVALSGCNQTKDFPFGAITITVKPGDTGNCAISPCRVLFEMPSGDGDLQVRGNQVDFGLYPAGKIVNLGDFYEPVAIEVVGAGVPKAYVYIPVDW
jgi:hypothetical protein